MIKLGLEFTAHALLYPTSMFNRCGPFTEPSSVPRAASFPHHCPLPAQLADSAVLHSAIAQMPLDPVTLTFNLYVFFVSTVFCTHWCVIKRICNQTWRKVLLDMVNGKGQCLYDNLSMKQEYFRSFNIFKKYFYYTGI